MSFRSVLVTRSYEQVAEQLLERIHAGGFAPSEKLPTERALGDLFGVSRGVIREAIKVLVTLGVVESRQGSGTFVSANLVSSVSRSLVLSARPEEASLISLLEFRAPLERLATELATQRRTDAEADAIARAADETAAAAEPENWLAFGVADRRFHLLIGEASRNPYLYTVLSAAREIQHNAVALLVATSGSIAVAGEHHRRIAAAIRTGDAPEAGRVMEAHVAYSADALHRTLAMPAADRARLDFRWATATSRPEVLSKHEGMATPVESGRKHQDDATFLDEAAYAKGKTE